MSLARRLEKLEEMLAGLPPPPSEDDTLGRDLIAVLPFEIRQAIMEGLRQRNAAATRKKYLTAADLAEMLPDDLCCQIVALWRLLNILPPGSRFRAAAAIGENKEALAWLVGRDDWGTGQGLHGLGLPGDVVQAVEEALRRTLEGER